MCHTTLPTLHQVGENAPSARDLHNDGHYDQGETGGQVSNGTVGRPVSSTTKLKKEHNDVCKAIAFRYDLPLGHPARHRQTGQCSENHPRTAGSACGPG